MKCPNCKYKDSQDEFFEIPTWNNMIYACPKCGIAFVEVK